MAWKYNPFTDEMTYYEPGGIPSPQSFQITAMYVDIITRKLVVEYEDET
jgi:hypothetical protein